MRRTSRTKCLATGPIDLVYLQPWVSHLEYIWEEPRHARFLKRLASFSRLILFDRRGTGLSDPVPMDSHPDTETRMDDARAVMDEVDSERAVVYGASESGALACLFAATIPTVRLPWWSMDRALAPPGLRIIVGEKPQKSTKPTSR